MNIVYHSTDSFAQVTATSMVSIFENNKWSEEINIYYLVHGLTQHNKDMLQTLADTYHRSLYFISMPDIENDLQLNLVKFKKWHNDSYCRMFFDEILPETVHKVLYLDCDILVTDSLQDLWQLDLQGHCAAAVADCLSDAYYRVLDIPEDAVYCNDGVLLFDLDEWKKKKIGTKVREYIKERNGFVFFVEQTVFSAVMKEELYLLPPKYNSYTMMHVLSYKEMMTLRKAIHFYTESDIQEAVKKPVIVHLTGLFLIQNRAWQENTTHPLRDEYLKYAQMTPWKEQALLPDMRSRKKKVLDRTIGIIPKCILLPIVSIIYNYFRVEMIERQIRRYKTRLGVNCVKENR